LSAAVAADDPTLALPMPPAPPAAFAAASTTEMAPTAAVTAAAGADIDRGSLGLDDSDFDPADLIALNEAIMMSMNTDPAAVSNPVDSNRMDDNQAQNAASLETLVSAGFDRDAAERALIACNFNVERAFDSLLNSA
jgi:hypothetical protein